MQYTVIENTLARVSRISFGTASLHHLISGKQRQRVLESAASVGITHFDTSPYYGLGLAEFDLGVFLQGRRETFTVASKVGLYPVCGDARCTFDVWSRKVAGKLYSRLSVPEVDWCVQRAAQSLNASLSRLKTDYVDFLFLHEPNISLLNTDEFLRWLETERAKGKVRYWGLAGLPMLLEPWLRVDHPLAKILQTKDNLETKMANFVIEKDRSFQFTYGYISSRPAKNSGFSAEEILRNALMRNKHGSILVSTRRVDRVKDLAMVVS